MAFRSSAQKREQWTCRRPVRRNDRGRARVNDPEGECGGVCNIRWPRKVPLPTPLEVFGPKFLKEKFNDSGFAKRGSNTPYTPGVRARGRGLGRVVRRGRRAGYRSERATSWSSSFSDQPSIRHAARSGPDHSGT